MVISGKISTESHIAGNIKTEAGITGVLQRSGTVVVTDQSDWNVEDQSSAAYIRNKPNVVLSVNGHTADLEHAVDITSGDVGAYSKREVDDKTNITIISNSDILKMFQ